MAEEASTSTTTETASGAAQNQQGGSGNQQNVRTFTQAEVDEIVKDRLDREKSKAQKAADEARRVAEAAAAEKNGEWQKLAEQRERELAQARRDAHEANIRATALKLGMTDPEYGVYLVTKAGENADAEAVLKDWQTKNPPAANQQHQPTGSQSPTNPDTSTGQSFTRKQLSDPAFYQANKQAILEAYRQGRIREE